jgi:S1-C subfamily serine protease
VTYRKWIPIAAAVLAAWPVSLAAQRTPRPSPPPGAFVFADNNRARIGVVVNTRPDSEADKLGATVEGVTPGGPAANAGLKVGDIITRFNGTALAGLKAEDEEESGPGTKLVQLARKLEPGDTVQIEYRRGSDTKKATLVAEDLGWAPNITYAMPRMPELERLRHLEPLRHDEIERLRDEVKQHVDRERAGIIAFGGGWGDLDLVTLNPELGEYFGTKEGVLVVKGPGDSGLPLRGGDVILSLGGRKPGSPSHAMRILRSYEAGETVSIEVMRKQNRMTVTWKVPKAEDRRIERVRVRPRGARL